MKIKNVTKCLAVLACTLAMPLMSQALTLTDALGVVQSGTAANAAEDTALVNSIVDRANGINPSTHDIAGNTYTLVTDPAAIIPFAVYVENGAVGGDDLVDLGLGGYRYLSVKYDGSQGTLVVWDIGGLTGLVAVPERDSLDTTSNNYNLFNAAPSAVPDGGATLVLLGATLVGVEGIRRRLSSAAAVKA